MTDIAYRALVAEAAARLAWYDAGYEMAEAYWRAEESRTFFDGQGATTWPAFYRAEERFTVAADYLATFDTPTED